MNQFDLWRALVFRNLSVIFLLWLGILIFFTCTAHWVTCAVVFYFFYDLVCLPEKWRDGRISSHHDAIEHRFRFWLGLLGQSLILLFFDCIVYLRFRLLFFLAVQLFVLFSFWFQQLHQGKVFSFDAGICDFVESAVFYQRLKLLGRVADVDYLLLHALTKYLHFFFSLFDKYPNLRWAPYVINY